MIEKVIGNGAFGTVYSVIHLFIIKRHLFWRLVRKLSLRG